MILANAKYGLEIELKEGNVYSLTIEAGNCFADIVKDLYVQSTGEEGEFFLTQNEKGLKLERYIDTIINPFELEFNNRKILNRLYDRLKQVAAEYGEYVGAVDTAIVTLLDNITSQTPYEGIAFDYQTDIGDLLKLYHVRIDTPGNTLCETLCEYIKVLSGLTEVSVLCLIDIKHFILPQEMELICKQAVYSKIILFLVQSTEGYNSSKEKRYIIDKDLCIIS